MTINGNQQSAGVISHVLKVKKIAVKGGTPSPQIKINNVRENTYN
jgi:hypothetical protein